MSLELKGQELDTDGLDVELLEQETIIDIDFHLQIPAEALSEFIEDPKIRGIVEEFGAPPRDRSQGWKSAYAKKIRLPEGAPPNSYHGVPYDTDDVLDAKRKLCIDKVVVTPGTTHAFSIMRYPVIKSALTKAYHDYIMDRVIDVSENVYAAMIIPEWDTELAVDELDRIGSEKGIVAGQNWFTRMRTMGVHDNDPIFDKMNALGLPLLMHTLSCTTRWTLMSDSLETITEKMLADTHRVMANAGNMVMTGLFDKYPDFNVVFQEGGFYWMPWVAHYADEKYQTHPEDVKLTERVYELGQDYLQRMPSEYVFDNLYSGTQPVFLPQRRNELNAALEFCRAKDTLMFASDFPHGTMDPPMWLFENSIPEDVRRRILSENAEEVLRFPN